MSGTSSRAPEPVPADARELAPDGFWYLCNASQYQIANLVPLLELGLERCGGVAILVARSDPPSENDRTQSIEPASRFVALVRRLAAARERPDLPVVKLEGHPDDEDSWAPTLQAFLAERQPAFTVYNYSHGTRGTVLAALLEMMPLGQRSNSGSVIKLTPRRPGHPAELRQAMPSRRAFPVGSGRTVTLDDWCRLIGYRIETLRDDGAIDRQALTDWLAGRLLSRSGGRGLDANDRLGILNGLTAPLQKRNEVARVRLAARDVRGWLKDVLDAAVAQAPTVLRREGTDIVLEAGAASYLGGGWFEELVFHQARKRFDGPASEVHVGVKLVVPDGKAARRELDVAIVHRNQLHLIECKTGQWEGGARNDTTRVRPNTLRTLAEYRMTMCGPYGTAALVSAHDPEGSGDSETLTRMDAEARRLRLWPPICGPRWRERLDRFLDAIVAGA
jgi:hypothetical protein